MSLRRDRSASELKELARKMGTCLAHRGPDDAGVWVDAQQGVALAHQRLSIIDLSHEGHQPMASADGRFQLVYNGEIYNSPELRRALESAEKTLRGACDTEILLETIAHEGLTATLPKLNGMFAFGIWDSQQYCLTLVRDRIGIKPLYYGRCGKTWLFASELKALRQHPEFSPDIDRDALALYVQHNYVPAPRTIYRGIRKLQPGTHVTLRAGEENPQPKSYWDPVEMLVSSRPAFQGDEQDASDEFERMIRDSTRLRMRADVPWGAFLSGGIDSSLVVATMQAQASQPVHTFCIGFQEQAFDEAPFARAIARHLGTHHTEHYVTADAARDVIPRLPTIYDEPFSDSSQIPTFLVCQLARQHVSVSLSGDGGDELFGGYSRYQTIDALWQKVSRYPGWLRQLAATALRGGPLNRMRDWSRVLSVRDPQTLYALLNRHWSEPFRLVHGSQPVATPLSETARWGTARTFWEQMMLVDTTTYLPDDILTKVDRASMSLGLEVRVPLLDHRLVEFAWSLPSEWKIRPGQPKYLLRNVLSRSLPRELFERPKVGFGVPIGQWLRGPLRDWAENLLDAHRLQNDGYFEARLIRDRWQKHLRRAGDWHYWLWDILMFQAWLDAHPS